MNSNRKKVKCLAVLAEVQQYVLQNKRDPVEVVALLQPIISENPADSGGNQIRRVVEKLKSEVLQGKLKGVRGIEGATGEYETLTFRPDNGQVFALKRHRWLFYNDNAWKNVTDILAVSIPTPFPGVSQKTRYIDLTEEDMKFFFPYFEKARNETEKEFLNEALNY